MMKKMYNPHKSIHGNLLDSLTFYSYEVFLRKQKHRLLKNEIFYEVELTVTQNQRWKQIFCEIILGGLLYPHFFLFNVLSWVLITEESPKKHENTIDRTVLCFKRNWDE